MLAIFFCPLCDNLLSDKRSSEITWKSKTASLNAFFR